MQYELLLPSFSELWKYLASILLTIIILVSQYLTRLHYGYTNYTSTLLSIGGRLLFNGGEWAGRGMVTLKIY